MKNFRKLILTILILSVAVSIFTINVSAYNIGDVIGYAQPTDIVATINGYQLNSYNVNGFTYIVVEDLRFYGMDVVYDNYSRTLSVTRNPQVTYIDPALSNPSYANIGTNTSYLNILYTDIVTYINGIYVNSYNINGSTIIKFDDLAQFGQVSYDNNQREISLNIPGLNTNPIVSLANILAPSFQSFMATSFSTSYKLLAPDSSCATITRARGNLIVVDLYIYSYCLTPEQIEAERQGCVSTHKEMATLINQLRASYPTFQGFIFNMHDGTGTCVLSHLYN